jgi:hypothetical protein
MLRREVRGIRGELRRRRIAFVGYGGVLVQSRGALFGHPVWWGDAEAHRYSGPVTRLGRLVSSAAGIELAGNVGRAFVLNPLRGKSRWHCHGHLTSTVTRIQG